MKHADKSHLEIESPLFNNVPHVWIQWKGTDVCADIHCECGAHLHHDGDFMYFVQCPYCEQIWEVGTHVKLYKPQFDASNEPCLVRLKKDED